MKVGKRFALLLLVYISLDFLDPSIPGVFFFDAEQLFVDTAIEQTPGSGLAFDIGPPVVPGFAAVPHAARDVRREPLPRAPGVLLTARTHLASDPARGPSSPSSEDH